jgi:hypothetical protein
MRICATTGSTLREATRFLSNLDSIITLSNVYAQDSTKFHTPLSQDDNLHAPANTPGIRRIAFAVECINEAKFSVALRRPLARRCLEEHRFTSLADARRTVETCRRDCNVGRP